MKGLLHTLIWLLLLSCTDANPVMRPSFTLAENQEFEDLNYAEVLGLIGEGKLLRGVEKPHANGSLGRNKEGYFHVRFQLNMTSVSDYALAAQNLEALEHYLASLQYAFDHQLGDGSFELVIPENLLNSPGYSPPGPGDLESGTAFFASSLGLSLVSLQQSHWFTQSEEVQDIRETISQLNPSIEKTLDYLIANKEILLRYDATAPNRLLFDALAYYALGKYLSRADAITLAQTFIDAALAQTDGEQGYFIEGGGWDSSYNGVAIKLAMELYLLSEEDELKDKLKEHILPASIWQISRIQQNGEVSTEGNTRVYVGGEAFLGREKGVDYAKTVKAIYYLGVLTGKQELIDVAEQVLAFYT